MDAGGSGFHRNLERQGRRIRVSLMPKTMKDYVTFIYFLNFMHIAG